MFFGWDVVAFLVGITECSVRNITQIKKVNLNCEIEESLAYCFNSLAATHEARTMSKFHKLDAHGFVHHSINNLEITNKMRPCIRIYYSNVPYCSTCFEGHVALHQKLKNCICSLWFYICLWLPVTVSDRQPRMYVKPEAANTVFELLMMSSVSLETC
jgi:hypothetical protein